MVMRLALVAVRSIVTQRLHVAIGGCVMAMLGNLRRTRPLWTGHCTRVRDALLDLVEARGVLVPENFRDD
jgi:hypothetical protein